MGCEEAYIFMNANIASCLCAGDECTVLRCVFSTLLLPPATKQSPPANTFRLQKRRVLSAVRRSEDCRLGDHYKGHKRAIYRTTGEWSQHSLRPPGLSCAGSPTKRPKRRIRVWVWVGGGGTGCLIHEGGGLGCCTDNCFGLVSQG